MVPCQLGSERREILQTPPSLILAETRRTDLTKNLCRLREKCDNGAYAGCNARPVQVVNKRVLVIYREADRVLPYRDALLAGGLDPVLCEAKRPLSLGDSRGRS